MIRVKQSSPSHTKITSSYEKWIEESLSVKDGFWRKGEDLFKEHDIKFVYGDEKADFGFSLHGNKVRGVPYNKCILFRVEPPIYNVFFGRKLCNQRYLKKFMAVMTDYIVDDFPVVHFNVPIRAFTFTDTFFDRSRKEFLCMILKNKKRSMLLNSFMPSLRKYNKNSNLKLRSDTDKKFCDVFGSQYDSYGRGWDYRCFKGSLDPYTLESIQQPDGSYQLISTPMVFDVLCRYKFNFCPENSRFNGYVTEKPCHAIAAGCVPIYSGAPDVLKYLPKGTFIDYHSFDSVESLCKYLIEMPDKEYQQYRKEMKKFAKSDQTNNFSSYTFAQKIISILEGN